MRNYPCNLRDSINRCRCKKEKSALVTEDHGLIGLISASIGGAGNLVGATDPRSHNHLVYLVIVTIYTHRSIQYDEGREFHDELKNVPQLR